LEDAPEACRALYAYWHRIRGDALLPRRAGLDPLELKNILPQLQIVEVQAPGVLRCKLVGTGLCDLFGFDYTGHNLIDLAPPEQRLVRSWRHWSSVQLPCGHLFGGRVRFPTGARARFRGVGLPLLPDREGAPRLLVSVIAVIADRGWINVQQRRVLTLPEEFAFLDIGAGMPERDTPPADWVITETARQ
jgi:hypothetical protein